MIILRIDDVGRVSGDLPEHGSDAELEHFSRWRSECGLTGTPAIYGVVPQWVTRHSIERFKLVGDERWAVHGFNHRVRARVTLKQMQLGRELTQADTYIAPFNEYTTQTVEDWGLAGGEYFLGGYELKVARGELPQLTAGVVFVPAYSRLYGMARDLLHLLDDLPKYPVVLTLHVPWETDPVPVRALIDKIRDQLVPIEEANKWL